MQSTSKIIATSGKDEGQRAEAESLLKKSEKSGELSELMKSHLDEVAGGLAGHGSWFAIE